MSPLSRYENSILRFGVLGAGLLSIAATTALWAQSNPGVVSTSMLLMLLNYGAGFSAILIAARQRVDTRLIWLIPVILLLVFVTRSYVYELHQSYAGTNAATTDAHLYAEYAAELVRLGENPYSHDLIDAYRVSRSTLTYNTPFIDGDFTTQMAYPSLSFLLFVPLSMLGISPHLLYPAFALLTFAVLFFGSPRPVRPVILLPFFADPTYLNYPLGNVTDIVWAFFICVMIWQWERRWVRAVMYGLACAFKQTPWMLAPFLLIRLWKSNQNPQARRQDIVIFAATSASIFLLFNGPFMIWDFTSWLDGITEPLTANMIYYGQGLSSLTMLGYAIIPKTFFTLFLVFGFSIASILYWRHYDSWTEVMWIVPGIILWFSHRSLTSYWYFFMFPLALAVARQFAHKPDQRSHVVATDWKMSVVSLLGIPVLAAGIALWSANQPPLFTITVEPPYQVNDDQVFRLSVNVTNRATQVMSPRFSVQTQGNQPHLWFIESGPIELHPGQTGRYSISTDVPGETFNFRHGARVIVADAERYDMRAATTVEGEVAARYIDDIPNGDYTLWNTPDNTLYYWNILHNTGRENTIPVAWGDDPGELTLTLAALKPAQGWATVRVKTWSLFPETPLTIRVKPPTAANQLDDLTLAYGLEVALQNDTCIWILFGDENAHGQFDDACYYWMHPAPRGEWSTQSVDLYRVFADLDIALPVPQRVIRYNQEFPARMVNISLLLAAQPVIDVPVSATFGTIMTTDNQPDMRALIQDQLDHPEDTLLWRGEYNLAARNYEKAYAYFEEALTIVPHSPRAHFGMAETLFWQNDYSAAIQYYETSLDLAYQEVASYRGIAWSHYGLGNLDASRRAFTHALTRDFTLSDVYIGLGLIYAEQDDCNMAKTFFDAAVRHDVSLQSVIGTMNPCLH